MGVVRLNIERRIKLQTTGNARTLRKGMTDAEQRLWCSLRGKQISNNRFRRQHPIGKYIADFACIDKKLVIELDGGQHKDQIAYDENRTTFLQMHGWQVLRFWNNDVLGNLEGVWQELQKLWPRYPHPNLPSTWGKELQASD